MKLGKEQKMIIIGCVLMSVSAALLILEKIGFYAAERLLQIHLLVTDFSWWLIVRVHFKSVMDVSSDYSMEMLKKDVIETIPLALAGGMIGRMLA